MVAAGSLLGGLALVRENALILVPVIAVWLAVDARRRGASPRRALLLYALGLALVLGPVALRNRVVGGEFQITTSQAGPNFYIGNGQAANGRYRPLRSGGGDVRVERGDAVELAERELGRELSPAEVSGFWFGRAIEEVRESPFRWLRLMGTKWLLFWNAEEVVDTDSIEVYGESSFTLRALGRLWHFGILLPLAGLGVWLTRREWRRLWLFYAIGLALAAGVTIFYVVARYRYTIIAILIPFAAAGIVGLIQLLRERRFDRLAGAGAIVLLLAIVANWRLDSPVDSRATTYLNLGISLTQEGEVSDALAPLERAVELVPDFPPAHHALGRALRRLERTAEAESRFRSALALDPEFTDAHRDLAAVLESRGRVDEAIQHFGLVLEEQPLDVAVHHRMGYLLAGRGSLTEAEAHFKTLLAIDSGDALAHNQLGNILAHRGEALEARAEYETALELDPDLADARFKLGTLLAASGDLESASRHLVEAARRLPDFAPAHLALASTLEALGDRPGALAAYQRALELEPGHPDAREALARLKGN